MSRYSRQILLPQIGATGQQRLRDARVLLIGCGALGTHIAEQLCRAGVGFIRIVDRDIVEMSNLQRQCLFDEADAAAAIPKAQAAAARLGSINSEVVIDPRVLDVAGDNILALMEGVDLVLDGTDNVATRYLINDAAVKLGVPWVYGACVGVEGRTMTVRPPGPCLRCIFPEPPTPGELPTCDTAGVLSSVAAIVASWQVISAIRVILGDPAPVTLVSIDGWTQRVKTVDISDSRRADCACCGRRTFVYLTQPPPAGVSLCGRDAVQIKPAGARDFDLAAAARRLRGVAEVDELPFRVRATLETPPVILTVFADGRAIVSGTTDPSRARAIYDRFVGA